MPTIDWDAEKKAREKAKEIADEARKAYVATYTTQETDKKATAGIKLLETQEKVSLFFKTTKFNHAIRQTLRSFDPSHTVTAWLEGQQTPLGGETKISPDHTPAFVLESHGKKTPSGAPGLHYVVHFGVQRSVEIFTTICLDMASNPYLYVHLVNIDGRTHESDWDNTLVNPTNTELAEWLKKEITLSGIKKPAIVEREQRVFLPD